MKVVTKSGIILPETAAPNGYVKLTQLDGRQCVISTPFIVAVGIDDDEDTLIYSTTSQEPFAVKEPFDTVIQRIKDAQG